MNRQPIPIGWPGWFALAVLAAVTGCTRPAPALMLSGYAMGTTWNVQIVDGPAPADRLALQGDIETTIARVEERFSTWVDDSELSRFNARTAAGWHPVSEEVCRLVERSLAISTLTGGAFDITVAPVVDAWGFGPGGDPARIPDEARIAALLGEVGFGLLRTDCRQPAIAKRHPGVTIDLSGFAKGYAVDAVADALDSRGVARYLVEIGGEIRARGANRQGQPWRVGIENPVDPSSEPAASLRLERQGLATSGDYRNVIELDGRRFHHIIDPRSGRPVSNGLSAVSVVHERTADADALATALLVLGPSAGFRLAEEQDIAAVFMLQQDGRLEIRHSPAAERFLSPNGG